MKRLFAIVALLALAALTVRLVVHRRRALLELAPPATVRLPVRVATVREGTVAESLKTVAAVQPVTSSSVAAQASGTLLEVRFREGDRVERGTVLARIDRRTLTDALESARARVSAGAEEVARQEAIHRRDQALFAGKAISRQAFEAGRAQLEAARAADVAARRGLESARTARGYADVLAPFPGVVTARLGEPGDLAVPGRPLFTIQALGPVKLVTKLSQAALAQVAPGTQVTLAWRGQRVRARVTRIFPALDASRLGSVEAVLPEPPFALPAGAVVSATYETAVSAGLVVPSLALLEGLAETLVVRVKDGLAEPVPVQVLARGEREAAVRGALAPGDLVVTGLPSELMALTAGTPLHPVSDGKGPTAFGEGRP